MSDTSIFYFYFQGSIWKKAKFKLKIFYVNCKTWLRWKWGVQRCWVSLDDYSTINLLLVHNNQTWNESLSKHYYIL